MWRPVNDITFTFHKHLCKMENYTSFSEDSEMGLVNFSAHADLDRKTHIHTHMKLSPTRT